MTMTPTTKCSGTKGNAASLFFPMIIATAATVYVGMSLFRNKKKTKEEENTTTTSTKSWTIPEALLSSPYGDEMQLAVQLAIRAGENMIGYCQSKGTSNENQYDLGIETKSTKEDFCTKIDVENERLITEGIRKRYPNHKIIGEESTGTDSIPVLTKEYPTWIIDPIDGTTNFVSGLSTMTCVSIGLCVNGKPILGVVHVPATGDLYLAIKDYGAYRNGHKITKRDHNKTLVDCVIGYEFGYVRDGDDMQCMLDVIKRIYTISGCRATRSLGTGVLDLCFVATGCGLDCVYSGIANEGWKPWDYCAGYVIAIECGCIIESIHQDKPGSDHFDLYSRSIICAPNQTVLAELRNIILQQQQKQ